MSRSIDLVNEPEIDVGSGGLVGDEPVQRTILGVVTSTCEDEEESCSLMLTVQFDVWKFVSYIFCSLSLFKQPITTGKVAYSLFQISGNDSAAILRDLVQLEQPVCQGATQVGGIVQRARIALVEFVQDRESVGGRGLLDHTAKRLDAGSKGLEE